MKKSLIAASASAVALAAMPVVGVFATDVTSTTDNLQITINKVCSFGYVDASASINVAGVVRANGTTNGGQWTTGGEATATDAVAASDTLSKTMSNGTYTEDLGTTTLGVYCNNENGYTITATGADSLSDNTSSPTVSDVIPINATFYDSSTSTITSGWSYKVARGTATTQRGDIKNGHTSWAAAGTSAETTVNPVANQIIAGSSSTSGTPKTTTNAGDFFTITYGVGVDDTQSAGTYTGSITYNLSQL